MRRSIFVLTLLLLTLVPAFIIGYKLIFLNYPVTALIPSANYSVEVSMDMDGHGDNISLITYIPRSDKRQSISSEESSSGPFSLSLLSDGLNRIASWTHEGLSGHNNVRYSYNVKGEHIRYRIPEMLPIPSSYPSMFDEYLKNESGLNMDDPLVIEKGKELFPDGRPMIKDALTKIHRYLQDDLKNKDFSGYTTALTALKLGEASCNGKGRLFVALARNLNIPSRLVGGLILRPGIKKTSHQWVEVYINGHWVPFDTINDHFAEVPSHYLTLYYGDMALFKHTSDINFQYFFKIRKLLVPKRDALNALKESSLNIVNLYGIFERVGISQNLLKIILMIPLGALVTVIFRNIIGLETFGTFLPALIAAAARETGLLWGVLGFIAIIIISSLVRKSLEWFQLLHSPKMGVMLTTVVIVMMSLTVIGVQLRLFDLAHITLFPIAILAITAERFSIIETEQGILKALRMMLMTLIVVSACYFVMDSLFLQGLVLAFPEVLLIVIALNLWLGKWMGIRVMEFIRFRRLLLEQEGSVK